MNEMTEFLYVDIMTGMKVRAIEELDLDYATEDDVEELYGDKAILIYGMYKEAKIAEITEKRAEARNELSERIRQSLADRNA